MPRASRRSSITRRRSRPLYYAIAALWMRAGEPFTSDGPLIYWTRFLNVLLAAALVWVAYAASARLFPENRFVRLGVPLLVALVPQDAYYGIQSDVLSPLCFGLAFVGLTDFLRAEGPSRRQAMFTGLAVAATCLVKSSSLPLLAVAAVTLLCGGRAARLDANRGRRRLRGSDGSRSAPFGPVVVWFGWNLANFGDLTGNAAEDRVARLDVQPGGRLAAAPDVLAGRGAHVLVRADGKFLAGGVCLGRRAHWPLRGPMLSTRCRPRC